MAFTQRIFELAPPGGLFDETVIANLCPDRSQGARNLLVHRAVGHGEVLRLRDFPRKEPSHRGRLCAALARRQVPVIAKLFRGCGNAARVVHRRPNAGSILWKALRPGLFCLAPLFRRTHPHPFVVAAVLHGPSHVSLESALWHHGLIPEAVREVSSVTTQRSRRYMTPLGGFSFHRVVATFPRAGVRVVEIEPDAWVFIAEPLRAIADLVYLRRGVSWGRDGLEFLTGSMRVDRDDLAAISWDSFEEIQRSVRGRRVRAYLDGVRRELSR